MSIFGSTIYQKIKKSSLETRAIYGIFIILFIITILIRVSLVKFQSGDYATFSGWYDFLKLHGIHSFKYSFSDYNPPYTYFLYIATLLPVSKIVAIKSILIFFDYVLALSVYFFVKLFRPKNYMPIIASLVVLFLPTVLLTSAFWGQFDEFYTAFIVFSLYFGLKGKSRWAWIFFGIAIAIKLQAIFFLPVLLLMIFKRIKWYDAIWGIVSFVVLTFPPLLVGRSFSSIINIYKNQTNLFSGLLTLNAPSMWAWVPSIDFQYFNKFGIYLTGATALLLILFGVIYKKYKKVDFVVFTSLMLILMPFLLPQMHERYFFPAGIGSLLLAFIYPEYFWIAVAVQVITLFAYAPFLFGINIIPMSILAVFILIIICLIGYIYFSKPKSKTEIN